MHLKQVMIKNSNPSINLVLTNFLLRAIIGKLSGRALFLIGSRTELTTWDEIKLALKQAFGDHRDLDCLIQDRIILKPDRKESPYNFGMRCQDVRSLIISKLNSTDLTVEKEELQIRDYDNLALKMCIRGLSGRLQDNIRLRNPESTERAMALITEENFMYAQNVNNTLNTNNYKIIQKFIPANKPATQQPNRNYFPNRQNFIKPTDIPFRSFNQEHFSKNINTYVMRPPFNPFRNNQYNTQDNNAYFLPRPTQIVNNRLQTYKPEPMETYTISRQIPLAHNSLLCQNSKELADNNVNFNIQIMLLTASKY